MLSCPIFTMHSCGIVWTETYGTAIPSSSSIRNVIDFLYGFSHSNAVVRSYSTRIFARGTGVERKVRLLKGHQDNDLDKLYGANRGCINEVRCRCMPRGGPAYNVAGLGGNSQPAECIRSCGQSQICCRLGRCVRCNEYGVSAAASAVKNGFCFAFGQSCMTGGADHP